MGEHETRWFSGTLIVHGTEAEAKARWYLIVDVLRALGVTDISTRELERGVPSSSHQRCDRCWLEIARKALADRAAQAPATPRDVEG